MSSPVNQFLTHLEYMIRLFMLFVYFIDELPTPLTMRSFLTFLNQKLVIEKEEIPFFCFPLNAGTTFSIEFCGFVRGEQLKVFDPSPELDAEIIELNKVILPPDEELAALLDEESAGGCQLIRAAQYAGILPGGEEEHSEPMLDDEEWEEYIAKQEEEREEKKKKKKKKKGYGDWDSDDDGKSKMNGNGNENEEEQSEEDDELPEEYVELMKKEKRRKQKQKERKERLKRTRHSHMSYSVCEIKIGRIGRNSDLQFKEFDSVRIEFFIISLSSHEFRDRSIQNRLESFFIECRSFPQGLSVEWREMLLR